MNIGGALGPIVAWLVRKQLGWGIESVFRVAALSVFLMFWTTLFFYREPGRSGEQKVASVFTALSNMFVVLGNFRFVLFLVISSGFYIVFWQQYISVPLFIRGYVNPKANVDLILSVDPIIVILSLIHIYDRSVIQFVGNDQVFFTQDCRHRSRIGRKAGLKNHAGLDLFKAGDLFFNCLLYTSRCV